MSPATFMHTKWDFLHISIEDILTLILSYFGLLPISNSLSFFCFLLLINQNRKPQVMFYVKKVEYYIRGSTVGRASGRRSCDEL